jgi:hypothetical protein
MPTFYQNYVANTAYVTGGKPNTVLMQYITGISAISPLVAFYDIHEEKRDVLFLILARTPHETGHHKMT